METKINLNDWIKIKLTPYGEDVYRIFYCRLKLEPLPLRKDKDGYVSFQLWDFIQIFGSYIYMGNKNVIEPLEIIKETDE